MKYNISPLLILALSDILPILNSDCENCAFTYN
nr:MAG TPA: hypothetical protein [Caudoviricetes sp.]